MYILFHILLHYGLYHPTLLFYETQTSSFFVIHPQFTSLCNCFLNVWLFFPLIRYLITVGKPCTSLLKKGTAFLFIYLEFCVDICWAQFWYLREWIAHNRWWPTTFGSWSHLNEDTLGTCQKLASGQAHLAGCCTRFTELTSLRPNRVQSRTWEFNDNRTWLFWTPSRQWNGEQCPFSGWLGEFIEMVHVKYSITVVLFFSLTSVMLCGDYWRVRCLQVQDLQGGRLIRGVLLEGRC